jgi:hypothetical protein
MSVSVFCWNFLRRDRIPTESPIVYEPDESVWHLMIPRLFQLKKQSRKNSANWMFWVIEIKYVDSSKLTNKLMQYYKKKLVAIGLFKWEWNKRERDWE